MSPERRLQQNLFTGALEDRRTRRQKRLDAERERPKQQEMFGQREIAQFGLTAHPQMPLSPHTKLVLTSEDPRSEEEIERDRQRAAEQLTPPLFDPPPEAEPARATPARSERGAEPTNEGYAILSVDDQALARAGLSDAEIARLDENDRWRIARKLEDHYLDQGHWDNLAFLAREALDDKS